MTVQPDNPFTPEAQAIAREIEAQARRDRWVMVAALVAGLVWVIGAYVLGGRPWTP